MTQECLEKVSLHSMSLIYLARGNRSSKYMYQVLESVGVDSMTRPWLYFGRVTYLCGRPRAIGMPSSFDGGVNKYGSYRYIWQA